MKNSYHAFRSILFFALLLLGETLLLATDRETIQDLIDIRVRMSQELEEEDYKEALHISEEIHELTVDRNELFSASYYEASEDRQKVMDDFLWIHWWRAQIFYHILHDPEQALEGYGLVYQYQHNLSYGVFVNYAQALWETDRKTESIEALRRGIGRVIDSEKPYIYWHLGWYYFLVGNVKKTVECGEESYRIDHTLAGPIFNTATAYFAMGDDIRGLGWFGLGLAAGFSENQDNTGVFKGVIDDLESLKGKKSTSPGIKTTLALLYCIDGKERQARDLLSGSSEPDGYLSAVLSYLEGRQPPELLWSIIKCAALGNDHFLVHKLFPLLFFGVDEREGFAAWIDRVKSTTPVMKSLEALHAGDMLLSDFWVESMVTGIYHLYDAIQKEQAHKTEEAIQSYKKSLETLEKAGFFHQGWYTTVLNNLSGIYESMGRYTAAEDLSLQTVSIREKFPPLGGSTFYAISLNNLAELYRAMGRYGDARVFYRKARSLMEELPPAGQHPYYAVVLNNLAIMYKSMGRYGEAETFQRKALEIRKGLSPRGERPDYASSLNNLAELYKLMGRYREALPMYKEALAIFKDLSPKEKHPRYVAVLQNLAGLYSRTGREDEAEGLYKQAASVQKHLSPVGRHPSYVVTLNNLATLYQRRERIEKAEELFKEVVAILVDRPPVGHHPEYASALNNLAELYNNAKRYKEAEPLHLAALIIRKDLAPKGKHTDYVTSLHNLAANYYHMGRYRQAARLLENSLRLSREFIHNQFPGLSEREKAQFISTMRYRFEIIWQFAETTSSVLPEAPGLGYDALLATKAVLLDGAKKMRERILQSEDQDLKNTFTRWLALKERLARYLSGDTSVLGARSYTEIEQEANDLEKELSSRSEDYRQGFEREEYRWEQVEASLREGEAAVEVVRYLINREGEVVPRYAAYIIRGGEKKVNLVAFENAQKMEGEFLKIYRGVVAPIKADLLEYEMAGVDPEEEIYQAYWAPMADSLTGVDRVYLSPDGVYNLINLGILKHEGTYLSAEIDLRLVTTTRTLVERVAQAAAGAGQIQSPSQPETDSTSKVPVLLGYPAYDLGISERIAKAERIAKSLDYVKRQGESSGDRKKSGPGGDLPLGERENAAEMGLDLAQTSLRGVGGFRGGVTELPGSKEEVEDIARLYSAFGETPKIYLGDDALEEQVKVLRSPEVLHIATHGFFEDDETEGGTTGMASGDSAVEKDPKGAEHPLLKSGLLLAGCEDTIQGKPPEEGMAWKAEEASLEDGILTAYEAMSLDLDNTDLVVLSACETGRGEILNGEGVYGLQRAFQVAGAKAVIMSLWKVDDEATKEFMITFYRNYLSGGNSRTAYLETVREMRERYRDPFYWGAFVYVE